MISTTARRLRLRMIEVSRHAPVAERVARFWDTLSRNPMTLLGLGIILLVALGALLAPQIAPYDPDAINPGARLQPPSWTHPLGTDHLARDILSRLIYGARVTLLVGVISTCFAALIGTLYGAVAGYNGGRADETMMRFLEIVMAFPAIILAITLVSLVGPSLLNLVLIIGIIQLPHFARVSRGSILSLKEQEFVTAARAVGQRNWRILLFHIMPNSLTPIMILMSLFISTAIIIESALSFLGLGLRPPQASWGTILKDGQAYMLTAPWVALFPGLVISITILGYNLFGDGLRDALDPRSGGRY